MRRKIIAIDEEKCDGCGQCVPSCKEGALAVVGGKLKLVSEAFCDGLGACLGECPRDAIRVEEREADDFDQSAVERHLAATADPKLAVLPVLGQGHAGHGHGHSCPGSAHRTMAPAAPSARGQETASASQLRHWPVQLMLVSPQAAFLKGADVLLCADCVPFAYPDFHSKLLAGKALLVGCPKLDDLPFYAEKLGAIFAAAQPRSVTVARMEVPCCGGIAQAAVRAAAATCAKMPIEIHTFGVDGSPLSVVAAG